MIRRAGRIAILAAAPLSVAILFLPQRRAPEPLPRPVPADGDPRYGPPSSIGGLGWSVWFSGDLGNPEYRDEIRRQILDALKDRP